MPHPTLDSDPRRPTYRQVQPSESYGDVVTELQTRSGPGVIVVVLDLDQGWKVEDAACWIRCFRVEYQRRFLASTGQKDNRRPDTKHISKPVPMVRVFKSSVTDQEHAELVDAGAGVYDRSSPTDCQTPDEMRDRFAALIANESSASSYGEPSERRRSVEPRSKANPRAYNVYPPGIEPGMLDEVLRENLYAEQTKRRLPEANEERQRSDHSRDTKGTSGPQR